MKATKDYGPCAKCDKTIKKGDDFVIVGGEFLHSACAQNETGASGAPASAASGPKPRRRSPAQTATPPTPPATPPAARRSRKAPKRKVTKKAATKPKPRSRSQKAISKVRKGSGATKPQTAPAGGRRPTATRAKGRETACAMVVRLLCGQKHTDAEILKQVVAAHPERKEKSLQSAVSVNRSEINRGGFKRLREKYGLKLSGKAKLERMERVGRELLPASKAAKKRDAAE